MSRYKYLKKQITMKLMKGFLVIALLSLIVVSCNETKKGIQKDSQENVEVVKDVVSGTEDAGRTAEVVEADVEKVIDSSSSMTESTTKKCEGKCSKEGKSCDGSCKA